MDKPTSLKRIETHDFLGAIYVGRFSVRSPLAQVHSSIRAEPATRTTCSRLRTRRAAAVGELSRAARIIVRCLRREPSWRNYLPQTRGHAPADGILCELYLGHHGQPRAARDARTRLRRCL